MIRSAVVTGGARGIGAATVEMLVKDGWRAHVLDFDAEGLEELETTIGSAFPGLLEGHVLDLSDGAAIESVITGICDSERVETLVNNAGTAVAETLSNTSREAWRRMFDVNVHATFELCRVIIPHMISHGGGVIVNVASTAALVGIANRAAYCATKGAVLSLTRALAVDHAQHNIRVNAICPGTTNTGWISSILKNHPEPEVALEAMERRQLVGRLGDPDEIAHGIKFLIDNSFATGSCLVVDGGMTTT